MREIIRIPTEQPDVLLRTLAFKSDDIAYYEAIEEDREHLNQFHNAVADKYQTLEDVTNARLQTVGKIRLGIWDHDWFTGSINATPDKWKSEVEIGYWLRASATGKGYATFAV